MSASSSVSMSRPKSLTMGRSTPHLNSKKHLYYASSSEDEDENGFPTTHHHHHHHRGSVSDAHYRAPLHKTLSDGEILLERKKAVTTAFMDVELNKDQETYNGLASKEVQEEMVTKYRV